VNRHHQIHEINLATELLPVQLSIDTDHYLVFWWNRIPLGHLFISGNTILSSDELLRNSVEAIRGTIHFYSTKYGSVGNNEQSKSLLEVREKCDKIFKDSLVQLPNTCSVSVIICTRDRPEQLENCLTYLKSQVCKPAEIIVVDNASVTEQTRLVALKFGVNYVREDRPGLDIARNTGAKLATQEIVAYTDDDTKPTSNWVYEVYRTFDDSSVWAMTGLVIAAELKTEAQLIFERYWPFNRGYYDIRYDQSFFQNTFNMGPPVWNIGAGANMAFRKSVLEKVGYFDERLDVGAAGCSGDSEIWYRILANGLTIQYNPRAVLYHYHRESMKGLQKQIKFYMRGFTVAILIQYQRYRHRGNLRHLFITIPKYYCYLLYKGFPFYRQRFRTLLSEITGIISGLIYFMRHRNTKSNVV
jgi:GT2 family glycosyltransferase